MGDLEECWEASLNKSHLNKVPLNLVNSKANQGHRDLNHKVN